MSTLTKLSKDVDKLVNELDLNFDDEESVPVVKNNQLKINTSYSTPNYHNIYTPSPTSNSYSIPTHIITPIQKPVVTSVNSSSSGSSTYAKLKSTALSANVDPLDDIDDIDDFCNNLSIMRNKTDKNILKDNISSSSSINVKSSSPPTNLNNTSFNIPAIPKRCLPVIISASNFNKRGCMNILCTKCDHAVMKFENSSWNNKCDYLFFRNNVPNKSKLSCNLTYNENNAAFCCQCSWINIEINTDVNLSTGRSDLRWICLGH